MSVQEIQLSIQNPSVVTLHIRTNENYIHEDTSRSNLGEACRSAQIVLPFSPSQTFFFLLSLFS
jgi:hypothetical protein